MISKLKESKVYIEGKLEKTPDILLILGSGLGEFANKIENSRYISYKDIPNFKVSEVQGHENRLVVGHYKNKYVIIMQGRYHYYEGYSQSEITYPIKVFKLLGVKNIIITNAAGGCNKNFNPGNLMVIKDHINFSGSNPLIGKNEDILGERFPDMSNIYNKNGIELLKKIAKRKNINLKEGVYMFFSGPSYETPAEIRLAEILGADAVGMSTVPEAIVANYCGMNVYGISCITNMAAGILDKPLNHKEVIENSERVKNDFVDLISEFIYEL